MKSAKDFSEGQGVMISLEYYIKNNGIFAIPPFGKVLDVNNRIVTIQDPYGRTWNVDKVYLENDTVLDPEILNQDNFNTKVVKNLVQKFIAEDDVRKIDDVVNKYLESQLNPYDNSLGKELNVIRAIEKYREFGLDAELEGVEDKASYLYALIDEYDKNRDEDDVQDMDTKKGGIGGIFGKMKDDEEAKVNPLDYLTDMTKHASENPYDKAYGREEEIKKVIRTVKHRDKKNAILVGKQGCGKTSIMEELANRIANGEIPSLEGKKILAMDVDGMIAGTKYRGMFEERCKAVLGYCAKEKDAIIFIDEVHKIMGAGGNTEGGMNLGNLMKTYLTSGITVIGATTYDEYANLKDDAALARRFGIIPIEEQEPEVVKWIMSQVKDVYTEYHGVEVSDTLLDAIVDTFDQKNYNTAGIDYAKGALDSICTIMEMDGVPQSVAFAEFMAGQDYDKEENNEYVKKSSIGFAGGRDEKVEDKKESAFAPDVQAYIDLLKMEEDANALALNETIEELASDADDDEAIEA